MNKPVILLESYFSWHYGRAFADMFHVWTNFLWFVINFFSIAAIINTFFDPWKRMGEGYPKGLDISGWLTTFTVNALMRFVGVMIRTTLLLISFVFLSVVFLVGIAAFLAWTFMPVVFVALVIISIHLIFYA